MIITLDGPSGTGKSTLAKLIAKELNYKFLNTGMIYRAITHYFLTKNITPSDEQNIYEELKNINIDIEFINNNQNIIINGLNCTKYVSAKEVQTNVSLYSQILAIRQKVLEVQRDFAKTNSIVIEGRDIGTEVFPKANYKFYVDCDVKVRARRRYNDLVLSGQKITLEEVIKSLKNRDYLDMTREHSPLKKPDGAITIDTSNSTIEETLHEIMSYIK